jgi:hypothetical protein
MRAVLGCNVVRMMRQLGPTPLDSRCAHPLSLRGKIGLSCSLQRVVLCCNCLRVLRQLGPFGAAFEGCVVHALSFVQEEV